MSVVTTRKKGKKNQKINPTTMEPAAISCIRVVCHWCVSSPTASLNPPGSSAIMDRRMATTNIGDIMSKYVPILGSTPTAVVTPRGRTIFESRVRRVIIMVSIPWKLLRPKSSNTRKIHRRCCWGMKGVNQSIPTMATLLPDRMTETRKSIKEQNCAPAFQNSTTVPRKVSFISRAVANLPPRSGTTRLFPTVVARVMKSAANLVTAAIQIMVVTPATATPRRSDPSERQTLTKEVAPGPSRLC
mmetsp:Transcript_27736/g.73234  ORF Transcript_27736/g.73234 Transcript_27736/m.73234 type:complete len:244 (+) Transcript_27736:781-1512(+)